VKDFPRQYNLQPDDVVYYSHIPKTAGMTFRTLIEDHFDHDEICPATLDDQVAAIAPADLSRYRLFRGHLVYVDFQKLLFQNRQKRMIHLTMLREPVAQLISHYGYIRRMPEDPFYPQVKDMTLEEYASSFMIGGLQRNVQTYHIAKAARFDIDGLTANEVLAIAQESLNQFAFTGLVERFQDSLFLLSYIFGWRPIMNNRQENIKSSVTSEKIPESTLALIREATQLDQIIYQQAQRIFSDRFDQMVKDLGTEDELENLLEQHYERRYLEINSPDINSPDITIRTAPQPPMNGGLPNLPNLSKSPRMGDLGGGSPESKNAICHYDFSQALRGRGWQRREYPTEGLIYRWTGPDTVASLDLPIAPNLAQELHQDLLLEFRVICTGSTAADILTHLTVGVNGVLMPLQILHYDSVMRLFQCTIPKEASSDRPFTRLEFFVNRVVPFRSLDPQDSDRRSVGVAINEIQIFPVEADELSLAQPLFEREHWPEAIAFLRQHVKAEEAIVAPLSFQTQLAQPIRDVTRFSGQALTAPWVVLHKDQTEKIGSQLLKLWVSRFRPVFANGVFVIFTVHPNLPKVPYTSVDVKPLYVDIVKRLLRITSLKNIAHAP
jgi:hypothetical protein